MREHRGILRQVLGLRSYRMIRADTATAGSPTQSNPARWWRQTRMLASLVSVAITVFGLVCLRLAYKQDSLFTVAGIPAGILLAFILFPVALWALVMWHEGQQDRIAEKNRIDERD